MKSSLTFVDIGIGIAMACGAAMAEQKPVYRCGQAYQDSPCPNGREIDARDERSDAEREAARKTANDAAERGSQMERDRLIKERLARPQAATAMSRPASTAREPLHHTIAAKRRKAAKAHGVGPVRIVPMKPASPP